MNKFIRLLTTTLFLTCLPALSEIDTSKSTFYLYSYFQDGTAGETAGTFLMISNDGINWDYCNNNKSIIKPSAGSLKLMRDPCLFYAADETFHLVWTTGWTGQDIGYAYSKDLITWSEQGTLSVMSDYPNASMCWAPEIFYNDLKQEYMIYWSSDTDGTDVTDHIKKTFYVTTKDFKTFSTAKELFSQQFSEIDATLLKTGDNAYTLFFKNDTAGSIIYYVTGSTPEGPWSSVSAGITKTGVEGPSAIKIGDEYRVYFIPYSNPDQTYRYVKSTNLQDWTDGDPVSLSCRQGNILQIPKKVALWLLYGIPMKEAVNPGTSNLTHQWTFDDGTADDKIADANGDLKGGASIENNALNLSEAGQYLELPADKIGMESYRALSMEIWFTSKEDGNPGNTMLCYFGNTLENKGSDGFFISVAREDNTSRASISCGNPIAPWEAENHADGVELDDGKLHQVVSVITNNYIYLYIDGRFAGISIVNGLNNISQISQTYAYLAKSGYDADPTWLGSIDKVSMYNKELSAEEILYLYQHHDITNANKSKPGKMNQTYNLKRMFGKLINIPLTAEKAAVSVFNLNGERICKYNLLMNAPFTGYPDDLTSSGMHIVRFTYYDRSGRVISNESFKATLSKRQ
jgi:predicted GH43/DUF377 family glycosyl hydrolase